jgi:hypothetical protein
MRKIKILSVLLLALAMPSKAQNTQKPIFAKNKVMLYWGWNRAWYTNSDIRFNGPGYDFSLSKVSAHDRQTDFSYENYFKPDRITIPQTNAQIGYCIQDNLAVVLSLDHMKYVMDQAQVAKISGKIDDPIYNGMIKDDNIDLTNSKFLTFEHTDGLNYINLGLVKYCDLINQKNLGLSLGYGGGAGVLLPKTNARLFGFDRSDRFHLAGFGLDVRTSLNLVLYKHILAKVEAKYGYINMPDVRTRLHGYSDSASHDFAFGQINFGIGYIFGL